ncbi:MAG: tripartite tricarboxylate transporter substrate binding protein [Zoogloeaceae bacterium]|jgi:tripartite-type tricarboxylate transporter receptor subunit TctC|nr:tripartite tricarboxylate transporter substrate binding protein [Zoogloeaceae bacterium]
MRLHPRFLFISLLLAAGFLIAPAARAQHDDWPSKPIKLIVPFPPGGACDTIARIYGEKLAEELKQPVIIENKPGAGTAIAAEFAARSSPDGYTLSVAPAGQLTLLPNLNKKVAYDSFRDFAPISLLASVPNIIAANPALSVNTLQELITLAKNKPGKITYSSCGSGTLCHLTGERFKTQTGVDLLHIPYKGSAPAITALLGGEVDLAFDTQTVLSPQIRAGKVKALAITSTERSPLLPDVPTAAEAGLPGFVIEGWFSLVAPAATPEAIVKKLNGALKAASQSSAVREKLTAQGLTTLHSTPEELARLIRNDHAVWAKVIQTTGATLD